MIAPLEAVKCHACKQDACYVREDEIEDMPNPIYCVKCVVITPKTKEASG